jgi:hypothetical protein
MWGVLAAALVLVLVLIRRTLAAQSRVRAEVERIVKADLEQLIENDPIPDWPPGVERFFEIVERDHVPPIVVVPPPVHRGS